MYKILIDSCGEFTKEMSDNPVFGHVALKLQVGDWHQIDDERFDQAEFLKRVAECPACPKSACPSPDQYLQLFEGYDEIYIVTLSSNLSGSYNSAKAAVDMYYETNETTKIHIFDSCSASIGETLVGLKIYELAEAGLSFEEVVVKAEEYKLSINTYFVLDNLDTLRKNGRLSAVKAIVASTLSIKPIMGATDEGVIIQLGQKIGMKKALAKMAETVIVEKSTTPGKPLMISHCNAPARAAYVKDILEKTGLFSEITVLDTAGVSSMYANDGGVIIAV
jgi:DegV family protein with EDD domain